MILMLFTRKSGDLRYLRLLQAIINSFRCHPLGPSPCGPRSLEMGHPPFFSKKKMANSNTQSTSFLKGNHGKFLKTYVLFACNLIPLTWVTLRETNSKIP